MDHNKLYKWLDFALESYSILHGMTTKFEEFLKYLLTQFPVFRESLYTYKCDSW